MRWSIVGLELCLLSGSARADLPAGCLPPVGRLLPLAEPFVARLGVLDITFEPGRHDAEFRGCGLDDEGLCELNIHRRVNRDGVWVTAPFDERGFGEAVVIPRGELEAAVRLPPCPEPPPQPTPPPKRKRRRPAEVRPPVPTVPVDDPLPDITADREAIARARIAGAPGVQTLIERAWTPGTAFRDTPRVVSKAALIPAAGERLRIGPRLEVEVAEDGAVSFHSSYAEAPVDTAVVLQLPVSVDAPGHRSRAEVDLWKDGLLKAEATLRGEGLNALDGADMDAPLKRAYTEATREARMAMYVEHRRKALNLALLGLGEALSAVRRSQRTDSEKARAIFALWSQATNESEPGLDPRFETAGAEARAQIEGFVRRSWPTVPAGFDRISLVGLHREHGWSPGRPVFDPFDAGVASALERASPRAAPLGEASEAPPEGKPERP